MGVAAAATLVLRSALIAERMNPLFIDTANFVAARDDSDRIVGAVQLRPVDGEAFELASLYVEPESRGQGTGSALVQAALGRAPHGHVYLLTLASASSFYQRLGFSTTNTGPLTLLLELGLGQIVRWAPCGRMPMALRLCTAH